MVPNRSHRENNGLEARVLTLAMVEADGAAVCQVLAGSTIEATPCSNMTDLCRKMGEGAGVVIVTHKVLAGDAWQQLSTALDGQPPWSDIPIILLTGAREEGADVWRLLNKLAPAGHLLLMERPLHAAELVTAVRTALQSRRRQYEARNLLLERQRLIDAVPVLLGYIDRMQRYQFVNREYEDFYGMPREKIVGLTVRKLIGTERYRRTQPYLRRALKGELVEYDDFVASKSGSVRTILVRMTPDRGRRGIYVSAIDITEARDAVRARSLSAGLIRGQEEERSRIARELHDDFVQRAASLAIELDSIALRSSEPAETLRLTREGLASLGDDIHRLSYRLHPSILDDLGLEVAIQRECENAEKRGGLAVEFRNEAYMDGLSKDMTLCLFRIAQEALHNVTKHARAHIARVTLKRDAGSVQLLVEDDGVGFDGKARSLPRGLGLSTMRERVAAFEGRFALKTQRRSGTKIEVIIPTG